jgi:hypothetical protein
MERFGDDFAKNAGLSVEQLTRFLSDIDYQPPWRQRSDLEADFYDGNQYDAATLQEMERRGIPPIVVNLIAPTINLILGMEAKVRQDWIVRPEDDDKQDFALALSKKLQEAERETHADKACSDAYAGQVKAGLHWVHTRRQRMDPFGYPYVVEPVHRREIWWDWQDTSPGLSRARWLVRRKWYDFDVLYHMFPRFKKLIDEIRSGWSLFESRIDFDSAIPLYQDFMNEREFPWDEDTWRNLDRKQAMLYEVWYRVPRWTYILSLQNGFKAEFDKTNPVHRAAVASGNAEVDYQTIFDMRLSWWLGPHRIIDKPSPLPHSDFPYVPFWGYREDRTAVPYGHIRAMKPLQDEVNARRARMLWQLSARRIIGYDDAVKDKRAVEREVARPDAAIWLDGSKRRMNQGINETLKIEDHQGLNAQQMEAYRDAAERLQDVANVFKEQLGKAGAGAESGIAISQLIEQGTTALAELNENYTFGRRLVGQQLMALIKVDIGKRETEVRVKPRGSAKARMVKLNERKVDETTGREYRDNDVAMTRSSVVLDAVPASGTFRQHQFKELAELVKKLPPELQSPMLDMVVEASDVPFKDEIVQRIREALGIQDMNPEEMSPQEQQALEDKSEIEDLMQQLEVAMMELAKERADLENRKLDAETEKTEAETEKVRAETVGETADTKKTGVETARLRREPIRDPNAQSKPAARPTA